MFYALMLDANGDGTGSHAYVEEPSSYPANEIACTQEQAKNPTLYQNAGGVVTASLKGAQSAQKALILSAYQKAINAPVTFKNAAGVTSTYPSGNTLLADGSRAKNKLEGVIAAGASAWMSGKWLDTSNVAQTFTFSDLQGLAAVMESAMTLDWSDLVAKYAEIDAATTVAAVQAITF
jgi:hypothetical protein